MRVWMALACVGLLAACANDTGIDNTPAEVAAAAYVAPGPRSITLMTMINNRTGSGGHTALVVNGSQQVIFDPAGSFRDPRVIERGDVLYGMTPKWIQGYKSSHARSTYHVVSQEIQVTDAQAEQILQLVMSNGTVAGAFCANATSGILSQVQGFESISKTFYPAKLSEQFASLPGVTTTKYYENDDGDVIDAVRASLLAQ
ncbi:hypothetical protein SAMN04488041_101589 [Sulfitobacter pontiacus]|jgi:hypothetical protein|uniref:Lipoprotein n=1 Tax=Sulfitobacter pontiacus TaxID=60137 RepID=A0A1H2RQI1_9RHOB|nr:MULTISPECIES: hypothetical protein [Sulfitobacter]QPO08440.1 hypothetical protein IT972_12995 [Sulfitobacter sp. B30-2]SDW21732.1 hypothetical protein SAMN04488041_101589 [Sulfitobacter pontiacus]